MRTETNTRRNLTLHIQTLAASTVLLTALTALTPPAIAQGGPTLNEVAKLLASDGAAGDYFGEALAFSGGTAVVGAESDSDLGTNSGSAYIFVRSANGAWTQQAKLHASDGVKFDYFGGAVAIDGDTAIVGAFHHNNITFQSGSAYIFVRDANGAWTQQAKLLASDGVVNAAFGVSAAIVGDTVVIGAVHDTANGLDSGSAYVFTRDPNGVWTQQTKLLPADGSAGDQFGQSVVFNGSSAIIGAWKDDDRGLDSGSAYLFVRNANGAWTQQAKLLASDGAAGDQFGLRVTINSDSAVVGARSNDDNGTDSGSAYVFVRNANGVWAQQAKLLPSDGAAGDVFGSAVVLNGDTAIVAASYDDDNGVDSGSAYLFTRDGAGAWSQQSKLLPTDGAAGDLFGFSIAITGARAIVGSFKDDDNGTESGSAYIFDLPSQGSPADLNADGFVNGADLATLLTQWGTNGPADLNADGTVNGADLAQLLTNWGPVM